MNKTYRVHRKKLNLFPGWVQSALMLPVNLVWTMEEVLITFILYNYTDTMMGWGKYALILLLGTCFIVDSLFTSVLLPNLTDLSDNIRTGKAAS